MDAKQVVRGLAMGVAFIVFVGGAFVLAGGASIGDMTLDKTVAAGGDTTSTTAAPVTTTEAPAVTTTVPPPTTTTAVPVGTPTAPSEGTPSEGTSSEDAPAEDVSTEDVSTEDDKATVASLNAVLSAGQFTLSGVVPDEATATRLVQAANIAYGPAVTTDLTVSPDVEPPVWLAGAHQGITLIPMISEGSITASGDIVELAGTSPNEQYLAAFQQAVGATFGVSEIATDVEITNLAPPTFNARRKDGAITLGGVLPSPEIRALIVGGAEAAYGADNVVDNTVVGEGLYTSYWMYTMPGVFQLFAVFPDYEIDVTNGITTGSLNDGANFATGSSELDDNTQAVLNIGVALLVRDQSLGIKVTGHTDSVGSSAFNQRLSEARAAATIEYMIAAGVDPSRLLAIGRGEEEPIASNETTDGRASNRRVEFEFGPVQLVTAS